MSRALALVAALIVGALIPYEPVLAADPTGLRCEGTVNPLGIDTDAPRFSWRMDDARQGARQTAYHLVVGRTPQPARAPVWSTGRVDSDESVGVRYAGAPLRPMTRYYWTVRIWDQDGEPTGWAEPVWFETGLMAPENWAGEWIAPVEESSSSIREAEWIWHPTSRGDRETVYLRTEIVVPDQPIERAEVQASVDNIYRLYVNGVDVGGDDTWQTLDTHEVSTHLVPGANAIGLEVVNDGPGECGAIALLSIVFADGERLQVATDAAWRASDQLTGGWTEPGFDDSQWQAADAIASYGAGPWGDIGGDGVASCMLRREFTLPAGVDRARAYVSGLGLYELYINGQRVGEDHFTPGWTHYSKRIHYQTYDVTALLREGPNAVGAILGGGWWAQGMAGDWRKGPPRLILALACETETGDRFTLGTDETWRWKPSPVVFDSFYHGETYDARLEVTGWSEPGLDDSDWDSAVATGYPVDLLVAQEGPSIRVTDELPVKTISEPAEGVYVFDFAQNLPGWVRLTVEGPAGAEVRIRFAEELNPDGTIYTDNYRSARVTDTYILSGAGTEVWEPRFTYRGFRYAEVTGLPAEPTIDTLVARVAHTDAPWTGEFACSSDVINAVQHNIQWGQRSNMHSVPTDCPQRDERLGWMGDGLIFMETACWNMDWQSFMEKWTTDMADSMTPEGAFTDVAPSGPRGPAAPGWGDAGVLTPYVVWLYYGDETIIERNYESMRSWVEYMRQRAPGDLYEREGYGDWIAVVGSPAKPIGAAYYYFSTRLLAEMAGVLGRTDDRAEYTALAEDIKAAFHASYYDPETGSYPGGTQTSYVLPLYLGLVPDDVRPRVEANLLQRIAEDDYHPTTGFLGTSYLLPVLSGTGAHDVAARMATQETYPSWGYMVSKGATTVWELWNSDTAGPGMNSRNHFALGSVGRWFYECLAGIRPDPDAPGFKHFFVAPEPGGDITWASAKHTSPYGDIESRWAITGDVFELTVTVPPNTTAIVRVPGDNPRGATAGTDGVFEVPAGRWTFTSEWRR